MIKPDISIVIPYYKMREFIAPCLASIKNQEQEPLEVLIVDDASPENGLLRFLENSNQGVLADKIRVIRHQKNLGVSGARNSGIAEAKGKYCAFLDPDDLWKENHLSSSLDIVQKHKNVDVVSGPVLFYEEESDKKYGWHFADWILQHFPASLASNCFIQPSATLVRTELLQQAGGFDTSKDLEHIEDYDLWIRLVEMGAKFAFRDEITCIYRRHPGAASMDSARMARLHQNLVQKHTLFFLTSQRVLIQSLMHRTGNLNLLMRNPLFQAYASLFRVCRKIKRKLFAKPPA